MFQLYYLNVIVAAELGQAGGLKDALLLFFAQLNYFLLWTFEEGAVLEEVRIGKFRAQLNLIIG